MTAWLPSCRQKQSSFACRLSKKAGVLFLVFLLLPPPGFSNNLKVENADVTDQDSTANTVKVEFDISWENSFRDGINYDAAWVFVKYTADSGSEWKHATLLNSGTNPSGFSTGTGTGIEIVVPSDNKGAFIQRSSSGTGTLDTNDIQLVWDYGVDGVTDEHIVSNMQTTVFGLEMVNIPEGSFYAGDSTQNEGVLFDAGTTSSPLLITSESKLHLGGSASGDLDSAGTQSVDDDFILVEKDLPAVFPKGYRAIYAMKYELTQGEYTMFLDNLTRSQQSARVASTITGDTISNIYVMSNNASVQYRNVITAPSSGNGTTAPVDFSTTRSTRAANYLSWMDAAAFADWAALRPMTDLEFEKIARGVNNYPVADEYSWGSTSSVVALNISGTEDGTETITDAGANHALLNGNNGNDPYVGGDAGFGPLRVGIFATSSSSRQSAGAGYYGNMELTGNVWEQVVTIGEPAGRIFTGSHGDGTLSTAVGYVGNATNTDWPGIASTVSRGVIAATGSGMRGDSWSYTANANDEAMLSNRYEVNSPQSSRSYSVGFRAVRTAP